MAFTVTNSFTSGNTISASELNQNFDDIEAKINGNLTTDNLASNAGISNAQLANSKYETIVNLTIGGVAFAQFSAGNIMAAVSIPGLSTGSYTVTDVSYFITQDSGSAASTWDLLWGTGAQVTGTSETTVVNNGSAGAGGATTEYGAWTVASATITQDASNPSFLALQSVSKGTSVMDATATSEHFLTVSVKLTKALRS